MSIEHSASYIVLALFCLMFIYRAFPFNKVDYGALEKVRREYKAVSLVLVYVVLGYGLVEMVIVFLQ